MGTTFRSSVLESLFPGNVVAYEHQGPANIAELYQAEAQIVVRAAKSRRTTFAAGRLAARSALGAIGVDHGPLMRNSNGAPIWPSGLVGSITHTTGFCGAVVASIDDYEGVGIDAEGRWSVDERAWDVVLTPAERLRIENLPSDRRRETAATTFAAKEAFYKCQYQITASWLDYTDVEVTVCANSFSIRLLRAVPPMEDGAQFDGCHALLPTLVVTAIGVPNAASAGVDL